MNTYIDASHKCLPQMIRYIMDESYGSTNNPFVTSWVEIQAFDKNNINVAIHKRVKSNFEPSLDVTGQTGIKSITDNRITLSEWVSANIVNQKYLPLKIIIDLGHLYEIHKLKLYHGWWTERAYKNNVYVSQDGLNWIPVFQYKIDGLIIEKASKPLEILLS